MNDPFDDPNYDDGDDSLNGKIKYYLGANGLGSKFHHVQLHAQDFFKENLLDILKSHVELNTKVENLEKQLIPDEDIAGLIERLENVMSTPWSPEGQIVCQAQGMIKAQSVRLKDLEADVTTFKNLLKAARFTTDDANAARVAFAGERDKAMARVEALEKQASELQTAANPHVRVWLADDKLRMHAGFVEWHAQSRQWIRISGGMPLERGAIFVPAGSPVPDGEPTSAAPCWAMDWLDTPGEPADTGRDERS